MQHPVTLGLSALAFMLAGAAIIWGNGWDNAAGVGAMLFRAGLLLGLIWFAWPDLARIPWWLLGGALVGALIIMVRGSWTSLLMAIPAVLAFWFLVPRIWTARPK